MAGRAHREREAAPAKPDFERFLDRQMVNFTYGDACMPFERAMVFNGFAH